VTYPLGPADCNSTVVVAITESEFEIDSDTYHALLNVATEESQERIDIEMNSGYKIETNTVTYIREKGKLWKQV
jgi:hypothetical protein